MDPKVFEAHGGMTQPYQPLLPDESQKVSILAPWRSNSDFFDLFSSLDWSMTNELILMVPKNTQLQLPCHPHPNVKFITIKEDYNLQQIITELYSKNIINTQWFYFSTERPPNSLWTTLRSATKPTHISPQLGREYLWSSTNPFVEGLELVASHTTNRSSTLSYTSIQPITIDTTGSYTELCALATKYQTDKTPFNLFSHRHPYTTIYNMFLNGLRTLARPLIIGEIGVLNGASIRMWNDYFGEVEKTIHAFDIEPNTLKSIESLPNVKTHVLDSGNVEQVNKTFIGLPQFDLLLEDASHCLGHQVTCLRECMKYVAVGGFLIIEDIFRAIPLARFQEAIDAVVESGLRVEAYMVTPEHPLRFSPGWENDRMLIVRRLG